MAKAYRRPLLVCYLSQPPKTGDRGQDFRTLPGKDRYNPDLDALIRDIKARQGLVRSILEDEEAESPDFVARQRRNSPVEIFRGFASADPLAPMIVINDQDTKSA